MHILPNKIPYNSQNIIFSHKEFIMADSWHDDVKVDDMQEEFMKWFRALIPDDRDLFFKTLKDEYDEIKEMEANGYMPLEAAETREYIDTLQQEVQEMKDQAETKDFIENIEQEVNEIKQDVENTQTPLTQEDIEECIAKEKDSFIQENKEGLKELELVSETKMDNTPITLYSDEMIFPQQQMDDYKKELANNPNAKLSDHLDMDNVKDNLAKEQEFQNIFTQEVASLSDEAPSLEQSQKLNPDNYFKDLINWFDKKKLENENMPLTKNEFKQEFLEYCKNGMDENEMKILLLLANKEPSKLTKEHKDMINEGLKFNLTNNKLLDKGLETAIRAQLGENLINNNIDDFTKSVDKLKKSDSLIDKKMMEGTTQKLAQKIQDQTPNITQGNKDKLESISIGKEMPKISMGKGMSK